MTSLLRPIIRSDARPPGAASTGIQRPLLIGCICAYVAGFQWMYIHWLSESFGYFGFDYNPPGGNYLLLAWLLSVLPSLWMPLRLSRPSQLAYWVLYLTVLIPSMFVPLYAGLTSASEVSYLMVVLFAGFGVSAISYLLPLIRLHPPRIKPGSFWRAVGVLWIALTFWIIVVLRNNLQIVSLMDVYDVRNAADDLLQGSSPNYALMWLSGAINPLLLAWGLFHKKKSFVLAGILGQLLVYSGLATKGSLLSILFIGGFYLLIRYGSASFGLKVALGGAVLVGLLCGSFWFAGGDGNPIYAAFLFIVFMRTLSMGGLLSAQYYDFFTRNPVTHYSHIKGVNWFLSYPYANPIGIEVGSFYSGNPTLDSSTHFWATDGIAAAGLPGVLLISLFCAGVFWILDSAASRHDPRLAALILCYAAYNLANISIFTSLLSGGLGLLMFLLYLMPGQYPPAVTSTAAFNRQS